MFKQSLGFPVQPSHVSSENQRACIAWMTYLAFHLENKGGHYLPTHSKTQSTTFVLVTVIGKYQLRLKSAERGSKLQVVRGGSYSLAS